MPSVPSKLQVGTTQDDAYSLINNNFDNIAQDLRDFGASTSTSATVTFTIGANQISAQTVVLASQEATTNSPFVCRTLKPVNAVAVPTPFMDLYIDGVGVNNIFPSAVGFTPGLTTAQGNCQPTLNASFGIFTNTLAGCVVQILNRDTVSHTYTAVVNFTYIPIQKSGVLFR